MSPLFAATTTNSETLFNAWIAAYLANRVPPQAGSVIVSVPASAASGPVTVVLDADFTVISATATLRPNPQGTIDLRFRLYAAANVSVWRVKPAGSIAQVTGLPI